jgi:hypothetical protein
MSQLQAALREPDSLETMSFSPQQREANEKMTRAIETLNEAVAEAVQSGLSVELMRTHRRHGAGAFGDQVTAAVQRTKSN